MRMQWASSSIEQLWRPRLDRIQSLVHRLEIETVQQDLRAGALISRSPGDPSWSLLKVVPIGVSKVEGYSDASIFPKEGERYVIRALVVKDPIETVPQTDEEWGKFLGYPPCCIKHFEKNWAAGNKDHLLTQLGPSVFGFELPFNSTHNVTLRYIGVRPVFHLPCSFDCPGTKLIHDEHKRLAVHMDHEAWGWMETLLTMPYSVSVVKGIGEIVHPFFRLTYDTGGKVEYRGSFKNVRSENVSPISMDTFWEDNGFKNYFDMEAAHRNIIFEVIGLNADSVMDLGAGNGLFIEKIGRTLSAFRRIAVDSSAEKCNRGKRLCPDVEFIHSKIEDIKESADIVFISYNRLHEGFPSIHFADMVNKYLIVYSYEADIPTLVIEGFERLGQRNRRVHVYKRVQ
jgi:hypothetical protein